MRKQARNKNIVILYNEGLSLKEIGDMVGLSSVSQVYKIALEGGAKIRKGGSKDPGYETLMDLHIIQRLTQKNIADLYKVTPVTANRWLEHYGLRLCDRKADEDNE